MVGTDGGLRAAIVGVLVAGVRRRNPGAVVNAVAALAVAYLPGFIEALYPVEFRPWQRVYVEAAMLAHAVGMLGPYDDVWWWDHVTHALSATILGGAIHVRSRRRGRDPTPRVLAGTLVLGALWELVEYAIHAVSRRLGIEPLLVPYGEADTALDVAFDLVGALLVVALGDRLLSNLLDPDARRDDGE